MREEVPGQDTGTLGVRAEDVPKELASYLRSKGYYVSRHANWLIVMKENKIAALVYVYPLAKEVTVVDEGAGKEVEEWFERRAPQFKVERRAPLYRLS